MLLGYNHMSMTSFVYSWYPLSKCHSHRPCDQTHSHRPCDQTHSNIRLGRQCVFVVFTSAVLLSSYIEPGSYTLMLYNCQFLFICMYISFNENARTHNIFFCVQFLIYVWMWNVSQATGARCTSLEMWPTVIPTVRDLTPVPWDKSVLWRKCSVSQRHALEHSPVKVGSGGGPAKTVKILKCLISTVYRGVSYVLYSLQLQTQCDQIVYTQELTFSVFV